MNLPYQCDFWSDSAFFCRRQPKDSSPDQHQCPAASCHAVAAHWQSSRANRMKDHGILMSTDGPDYNGLKIKPPIVFTKENAEELIFFLHKILNEDFMKLSS